MNSRSAYSQAVDCRLRARHNLFAGFADRLFHIALTAKLQQLSLGFRQALVEARDVMPAQLVRET